MGDEVSISTDKNVPDGAVFQTIYQDQLLELAEIRQPMLSDTELPTAATDLAGQIAPVYVYFPWRNVVLETVPEAVFFEIKTNRNQLLITSENQQKLYDLTVSIAGMSVGSSILYGLAGSGIAKKIIIADHDTFSNANLNRVQATILDIGINKAVVAKRRALEMNPFLTITVMQEAVTGDNIQQFFASDSASIVFEEIDDFKMKVRIREYAKKTSTPFVMLTNLGDAVQIDVERYDTDTDYKPFHGLVSAEDLDAITSAEVIDVEKMKQLSVQLVDRALIPAAAMQSLQQIGKTLVGRPQLYSTVALDSGIAPYIVRMICLENSLAGGRYSIALSDMKKGA